MSCARNCGGVARADAAGNTFPEVGERGLELLTQRPPARITGFMMGPTPVVEENRRGTSCCAANVDDRVLLPTA